MIKHFLLCALLAPHLANAQNANFIRASQILDSLHRECGAIASGRSEAFLHEVDRQIESLLPIRPINFDDDIGQANLPPDLLHLVYGIATRRGLDLVHLKVDDILRNDRGHFQKYKAHSLLLIHKNPLLVAASISYPSASEIYYGVGSPTGFAARMEMLIALPKTEE